MLKLQVLRNSYICCRIYNMLQQTCKLFQNVANVCKVLHKLLQLFQDISKTHNFNIVYQKTKTKTTTSRYRYTLVCPDDSEVQGGG